MVWWAAVAITTGSVCLVTWYLTRKKQPPIREAGKDYPKDTVILHQFPRGPFAPSMSGFCVKLETFLKLAKIPYQNVHAYKTGPKGKSPWIEYNDVTMGDSEFIMSFLKEKLQIDMGKGLTPEQKSIGLALQRLVDEHLYWIVLLERWVYHRQDTGRTLSKLPSLFVWEIGRRTKNAAHAHGIGRHSLEDLEKLLEEDLVSLSDYLGDKKYFFGDEPTEIDCAVFGQLSQLKWHVPDSVKGKQLLEEKFTNLNEYCVRVKDTVWPDWDDCITQGFTKTATS